MSLALSKLLSRPRAEAPLDAAEVARFARVFYAELPVAAPTWVRLAWGRHWPTIRADLSALYIRELLPLWEMSVALWQHEDGTPAATVLDREDLADVLAASAPGRVGEVMAAPNYDDEVRVVAWCPDHAVKPWIGGVRIGGRASAAARGARWKT